MHFWVGLVSIVLFFEALQYCVFFCFFIQEMKQYHVSNGDSYDAETKLKHAQDQRTKVESQANKASKKLKTLEKQVEKVR